MQVKVYNLAGEPTGQIEVSDQLFAVAFNAAVVHQAMVRQMANARLGTANTKTRGEIAGSTRKLFRQKHTGMARAGSRRSPIRRGGGIVFGPKPRCYRQAMPKKMRRLALRCLLSAKAEENELKIIEQLELAQSRTKDMANLLGALEAGSSALIVTDRPEVSVIKSARNLPGVKTLPANLLNVIDLLSYRMLIMTVAAVRKAEEVWVRKNAEGEVHASL